MPRAKRGFTLIEALVAAVLLAVGVSGVLMALGRQVRTEATVRRREVLSQLAQAKLDELSATTTTQADSNGDFTDEGYANVSWALTSEDTGIENLSALTLSVTDSGEAQPSVKETTLVFTQPATVSTGAAQ